MLPSNASLLIVVAMCIRILYFIQLKNQAPFPSALIYRLSVYTTHTPTPSRILFSIFRSLSTAGAAARDLPTSHATATPGVSTLHFPPDRGLRRSHSRERPTPTAAARCASSPPLTFPATTHGSGRVGSDVRRRFSAQRGGRLPAGGAAARRRVPHADRRCPQEEAPRQRDNEQDDRLRVPHQHPGHDGSARGRWRR